ncbi:flagellar motor protein MotB, partial [Sphingomonas sp. Ant20]|uniref:flagellar motor protein MotB n=1 Tax=Sphingomonas sp. Ant20 TaxID=104605 RepID=UPI00274131FF
MTVGDYPEPQPGRPLWLITLADLALLLVGFFVLLQATQTASDRPLAPRALAAGLREGFGSPATAPADTARSRSLAASAPRAVAKPTALPVAAAGMLDFAVGSAVLLRHPIRWRPGRVTRCRTRASRSPSPDRSTARAAMSTLSRAARRSSLR